MKIKVWVVSTCIPEPGNGPCFPNVFGSEAEAEAYAEQMLREEWESDGPVSDDDVSPTLPYPGNWREANDILKRELGVTWGEWEITSHEIEIGGAC